MRIALSCLACVIIATSAAAARGEGVDRARLAAARTYLDRLAAFGFSGQVLIAEHGRIVLDESRGLADAARGVRVTSRTRFPVASLSKSFTALAILALESDGRLALADTLGRFLADVPPDKRSITIEHLLTHTAGLRRDALRASDSLGRDEAVRRILQSSLRETPGLHFAYSNSGYELLAAIVERASGESYDRFVRRRVFAPAGMVESGFVDAPDPSAPLARGNRDGAPNGLPVDPQPGWKSTGSGSAVSTAEDLARWHAALLAGRIVPAAARERAMAPRVDTGEGTRYGYGWFVASPGTDSTMIFHGGDTDGFHSELNWFPGEQRLIVILTNQDVYDIDGGAVAKRMIARDLRRILLGRPTGIALPAVAAPGPRAAAALAGHYDMGDGERLELSRAPGGMRIRASGSRAAEALLPESDTLAATQRSFDRRTRALLLAVSGGDTTAAQSRPDPAEMGFGGSFLASEIAANRAANGPLTGFALLGTAPIPWDPGAWRTYGLLRFERGDLDLYLGRAGGALNDVSTGTGFRSAVNLPVAALPTGDLVALDLLRQRLVPIAIERDAHGAILAIRPGGASGPRAVRVPG
ncbi:MAG TPA: serine hydrolase domain-containing protein [Candidatus Eisenbacteria bacterium]|nr:serine hydrolase domain-containing protein [Candidatus Eisenbacteria bacterium]